MDEEILEMMEETDEDDFQIPEFLANKKFIIQCWENCLMTLMFRKEDIFMTSRDQRQWKYQE